MTETLYGWHLARGQNVRLDIEDGLISQISETAAPAGGRSLLMPGLINAHDHARPLSPTSFGGAGKPLESWLLRLMVMPGADPYLAAVAAFGRAARSGCVSIMAHYTRWQGGAPSVDEALAVAKAARDIGVRVTFSPALRDQNPLIYGQSDKILDTLPPAARQKIEGLLSRPPMPAADQIAMIDACAQAAEGPLFTVQYGLAGVQWCSDALLRSVAEASARTGRRVHMHLLETQYQRAYADLRCPSGVLPFLENIGLVSSRLSLAHCVYARPDELSLIARSGATIVTNASSNLHLRSGIAPIAKAFQCGCHVATGIDASAFDEDDDALRELRLGHFLHGGWGYDEIISRADYLCKTVAAGRNANGVIGNGTLEPGQPADLIVLDLDRLDRDSLMPVDPLDYLFARANAAHVRAVFVAGRKIVADGKVLGVDVDHVENQLRAHYRAALPQRQAFMKAWPHLETAVAAHYRDRFGCS